MQREKILDVQINHLSCGWDPRSETHDLKGRLTWLRIFRLLSPCLSDSKAKLQRPWQRKAAPVMEERKPREKGGAGDRNTLGRATPYTHSLTVHSTVKSPAEGSTNEWGHQPWQAITLHMWDCRSNSDLTVTLDIHHKLIVWMIVNDNHCFNYAISKSDFN